MTYQIDWDAVHGISTRGPKKPSFSQAQIDAAVKAAKALPPRKSNPQKVAQPWDRPDQIPTVSQIDFRDPQVQSLPLSSLYASNKALDRDRLIWHIQNPGQRKNPSVFTANPIVLDTGDEQVIVDGHHALAALKMLGATSWPCYLLPTK